MHREGGSLGEQLERWTCNLEPWVQVQPLQVVGFVLASPEFKFLAMFAKLLTGLPTTSWNF